jgi:hypothetical protein
LRIGFTLVALEKKFTRLLCLYIRADTSCKHGSHRKTPVFITLALMYVYHPTLYIYICNPQLPHFSTAQSASITKTNKQTVF